MITKQFQCLEGIVVVPIGVRFVDNDHSQRMTEQGLREVLALFLKLTFVVESNLRVADEGLITNKHAALSRYCSAIDVVTIYSRWA